MRSRASESNKAQTNEQARASLQCYLAPEKAGVNITMSVDDSGEFGDLCVATDHAAQRVPAEQDNHDPSTELDHNSGRTRRNGKGGGYSEVNPIPSVHHRYDRQAEKEVGRHEFMISGECTPNYGLIAKSPRNSDRGAPDRRVSPLLPFPTGRPIVVLSIFRSGNEQ